MHKKYIKVAKIILFHSFYIVAILFFYMFKNIRHTSCLKEILYNKSTEY